MKAGRHSRTAEAAAAARAKHLNHAPPPKVFEDPYAAALTSPAFRRLLWNRFLCWVLYSTVLRSLRRGVAQVLGRSRYAEDCLEKAIPGGIRQYVLIGAGLDSFALRRRDLEQSLQVIELDHPDTQRVKRSRLEQLGIDLPRNVDFVPADLSIEDVAKALQRSRFEPGQPVFYSWLGTTMYLTNEATLATLKALAGCSAPGSEIVFDYVLPESILSEDEANALAGMKQFVASRGEPMMGEFAPEELAEAVAALGFEVVEDLSAADQTARYFADRSDGLRPPHGFHFVHLRLP
jgi:methyltransferase (TIGR00027 family)